MPLSSAERSRRWRESHPERYLASARTYRERNREKVREADRRAYKRRPKVALILDARRRPCVDCGNEYPPEVMELDHVRGRKAFGLYPRGVQQAEITLDDIRAEIAKCEPRCPTCHRLRHHYERQEAA